MSPSEELKGKARQRAKKWRQDNRDKHRAYQKAFRKTDAGKAVKRKERQGAGHARRCAKYRETHSESRNAYNRWYERANPDIVRAKKHRRRARSYAAEGAFTKDEWLDLQSLQGNRCIDCGEVTDLTVGHAWPLVRGGSNDIGNIIG